MYWKNYSPNSFGWSEPKAAQIKPFRHGNVSFGGGVHLSVEPIFREALRLLVPHIRDGLHPGWCWGYSHRVKRGASDLSFHAYGLALDLNAPNNPFVPSGAATAHTLPDSTAELVRPLGLEWGGAWTSPKDYMHLEFHGSPGEAAEITARLAGAPTPAGAQAPHKAGLPAAAPPMAVFQHVKAGSRVTRLGCAGDDVAYVQRWIGSKWCGSADGAFGRTTAGGVTHYQQMRGLKADGIVGPVTWHDMGVT
jgi:hypothetical protein